jgi:hypothetical protein
MYDCGRCACVLYSAPAGRLGPVSRPLDLSSRLAQFDEADAVLFPSPNAPPLADTPALIRMRELQTESDLFYKGVQTMGISQRTILPDVSAWLSRMHGEANPFRQMELLPRWPSWKRKDGSRHCSCASSTRSLACVCVLKEFQSSIRDWQTPSVHT